MKKEVAKTKIKEENTFIDANVVERILTKKKAVCEIKYNDQIGTGFFCEITIKKKPIKVLFTNNHVLDKKAIENENKITLIIDNKKYILKISKDRFKCTNINLDYSCIEILEEDNIDCDTFKIDEEINTDDPTKTYKLEEYAIIQYPEEKLQITKGKIESISNDSITHYIPTKDGSSGSPIIALNRTLKLIGIHCGGNSEKGENKGSYFKHILDDILEEENKTEEIRIVLENKPLNDVVIGIDLGTTNTCAAIVKNDKIEIIKNDADEKIIPSVVCYTEKKNFVGTLAKNRRFQFPESTVFESKRLIGKKYHVLKNNIIQDMINRYKVKIIEDQNTEKPQYIIKIGNKEKKISPEEVSAEILKEIKKIAEKYNKNIKKAVITVPAHFKEKEKDATIEAAKIAGLEVIQLISEPIAIAIAYGNLFKSKSNKERTILIFDLGAGSLGISIVKINGNEYSVLGSDGEDNLGGENFSQKLMDYFIQEIKKKYPNETLGQGLLFDIKNEIENIKTTLSIEEKATFKVGPINGNNIFEKEINIKKYIELCEDLCKRCIKRIDKFLKDKSFKKKDY